MKDKLVFVKTRSEKGIRCPDCHLGLNGNCQKNKAGIAYMHCEPMYNYKLAEEPEEIQSEYEWVKERYKLLNNTVLVSGSAEDLEMEGHRIYLERNKPEKWVVCSKENTKVGDEVRCANGSMRKIMYIQKKTSRSLRLCCFIFV